MIGSIVNADTNLLPAFTAEFAILARAVTPATCKAENLAFTVSTPFPIPDMSQSLAAALTDSKPLAAPSRFKLLLSFSSVDIEV